MAGKLTPEQIVAKIEAALLPHKAEVRIHDFGTKITTKVHSANNGSHVCTLSDSSLNAFQEEQYLDGVMRRLLCEVEDKIEGRSSSNSTL